MDPWTAVQPRGATLGSRLLGSSVGEGSSILRRLWRRCAVRGAAGPRPVSWLHHRMPDFPEIFLFTICAVRALLHIPGSLGVPAAPGFWEPGSPANLVAACGGLSGSVRGQ